MSKKNALAGKLAIIAAPLWAIVYHLFTVLENAYTLGDEAGAFLAGLGVWWFGMVAVILTISALVWWIVDEN